MTITGIILIGCVPLLLGALWGAWKGQRGVFSLYILFLAPFVSAALIGTTIASLTVLFPPTNVDLGSFGQWVSLWWFTALLHGGGIGIFGAVPALVGSATVQLVRFRMVPRD
jgi:hypothetical protein